MKGLKFRFSKKLLFMAMGGIVVLGGGSGAAAVFIGSDKILGPSYLELNGLACTSLDTVKIKKDGRYWVRKYVISEEAGDGLARLKTALRVARAVQEKEKADLVQVAMLDKGGPKDRSQMRGRMIGAQVVYIPDLHKAPEGINAQTYSAYYLDGHAAPDGEYYGMRIDLPLEDVEGLTARLTDKADCIDPAAAAAHGAPADGHGAKPKGKGKAKSKGSGGHGEAAGHGGGDAHGSAAPASGHGEAAPSAGHDAPAEGHGEVAAKPSGGFLSSITGMIFGSKSDAPAEGHAPTVEGANHAAAPAAGHEAPAGDHANAATVDDHGGAKPSVKQAVTADHGTQPQAPKQKAATAEPKKEEAKKEESGFLSSLTGMVFGSGGEAEKAAEKPAEKQAAKAPAEPAPEPRTSAEGGKRWSKSTDSDAVRTDTPPQEPQKVEAAPPPSNGETAADAAGAAWLAKMRGQSGSAPAPTAQPVTPAKPAKPDQEASAKPSKAVH